MSSANAATLFADRAIWQNAAGGGVGDIFDDFNDVLNDIDDLNPAVDRGPYSILEGGGEQDSQIDEATSGLDGLIDVNGTSFLQARLEEGAAITEDELTLIFDTPISALGYDLNPHTADTGNIVSYLTDMGEMGTFNLPDSDATAFLGFIFDEATSSIRFRSGTASEFAEHGIDDLEAFSVAGPTQPIPEPSAALMIGLGLAGLSFARRT